VPALHGYGVTPADSTREPQGLLARTAASYASGGRRGAGFGIAIHRRGTRDMQRDDVAGELGRKYRLALAAVALLVLGDQALVQPFLARLTTDAPMINLAGRQRMLSQRLAKAALAYERGSEAARDEIGRVRDQWARAHASLRGGRGTGPGPGPAIGAGLAALEPHFDAMRDAAGRLVATPRPAPAAIRGEVDAILAHEPEYLRRMDGVVALYEAEARARVSRFRRVGWALAGLTLAALAAIGRFILHPAVALIRAQVAELGRARDELEGRVQARTRELEAAQERHRALLEQFSHVGRTSAAGEMASSLAHELNQPLGAIANYAEGCLIALDAPAPELAEVRRAVGRIRETTMRAGRIMDRVRRFVTRQVPSPVAFAADDAVRDALEIVAGEARRRGVGVRLDLAPGLPGLRGDPVQVQQVLVNLVRNALDALAASQPVEPSLVIWTRPADPDAVELGVTDNGEGIPADLVPHVFDAYFSTRAESMGMGLAICRTIVEAHQGRIVVESDPGVTTTFRVRLPAAPTDHERADGLHRG
jgi:signal transduction histidine kinase